MIALLSQRRTPSTLLGLAFNGSRLEGVVLRRSNGSMHVQRTFTAALTLNPLNGDPELVGREIRNHLEQAGIRQRRCVVCVPINWALTLPVKVPDLPEEDVASFLEIEAERGFPYGPEALSVASSRFRSAPGQRHATLVAIPRTPLHQLEQALRAAQLRPVSFTLGIAALQPADADPARAVVALALGENAVDLQVTCHGGIAALRAIEGAIETEGAQRRLFADVLAREIRVTLGQLPPELREGLRTIRLFGHGDFVQRAAQELGPRLEAMGLQLEVVSTYAAGAFRSQPPAGTAVSPAFSAAARLVAGDKSVLEFLPPRTSALRRLTTRFSSRKLAWSGGIAAAALLVAGTALLAQQWQLSRLHSQWAAMEPRVRELEDMQQQIRRFRPWFDESFQNLSILRGLARAFPAEGLVTAKSVEIHDQNIVTCSGVARDNQAFLRMLDQLRATREIGSLKVDMVRGKSPLQFTLNFQWGHGGANEN